jgi:hypothetical protein
MVPREELSRWLADPKIQHETISRFADVAKRFRTLPIIERLGREVEALTEPNATSLLACAQKAMLDEDGVGEMFSCLIEAAAADPYFRPALRSLASDIHTGILLFESPQLTLFVSVMPAEGIATKRRNRDGARSIVFPGYQSLYRFVRSGGATFSFWEAPIIDAGFTASGSGRCRLAGRRRIADGELLQIDGRTESFVIDHAVEDLVYLQAMTSAGRAPLTVEYDSDTHEFVGASSTDEISSRTQLMLSLLRAMDRSDAASLMIDMLDNPHFYARWQTMRELLALDAEAGLPHLAAMAKWDPHPEVRAAAAATLGACFPEAVAPKLALEVN